LETPCTMLDTRLRVSPWSDRLSRSSLLRLTSTCRFASSYFREISGRWEKLSLPLGPSIWIVCSTIETFTLAGTTTGLRPIRDMGPSSSARFTGSGSRGFESGSGQRRLILPLFAVPVAPRLVVRAALKLLGNFHGAAVEARGRGPLRDTAQ